jgi:hypothetical protein
MKMEITAFPKRRDNRPTSGSDIPEYVIDNPPAEAFALPHCFIFVILHQVSLR